ncbi:MAG: hypothetical protein AAGM22_16795, partial [Acidobacteriota bacterium]
MFRRLHVLTLVCFLAALPTWARQGEAPYSFNKAALSDQQVDAVQLLGVDVQALLAEDASRFDKNLVDEAPAPVRFAVPVDLRATPKSDGTWTRLENGWLWRLDVLAPGATDLNFGFGTFDLPKGAKLWIVGDAADRGQRYFQGPYTGADVRGHGQLWTPVVPGEAAQIELVVPHRSRSQVKLMLTRVGQGYRDLFNNGLSAALKQGSCN